MSPKHESAIVEVVAEGPYTVLRRERHDGRSVLVRAPRGGPPGAEAAALLRYGAAIEQALDVPGVPRVLAVEEGEGGPAVVLEDPGGSTLRCLLSGERIEIAEAVRIAMEIARVLGAVHACGVVHGGVEPSRVLVNAETGEVRLTGFDGASRLAREDAALGRRPLGPLAYVAPEQTGRMNRAVDFRADLYALGVVLYEMLTGRVPFEGEDRAALVHAHLSVAPVPPELYRPSVPRALSEVVAKLLAKDADDRYQSAAGLISDLEDCLGHLVEGATLFDFTLGRNDTGAPFRLPERLYGRAAEREKLLAAFDRARASAAELVIVSGPSGVGKTRLVNELHAASARERGYFCAGGFDPESAVPYGAIRRAMEELCDEILSEGEERAASLRRCVLEAVGPNAPILVEAIPALGRLIGQGLVDPVPELGPLEARDRGGLAFQQLVAALARREHPLTIFLDDLQWADDASLRLLPILLRDPAACHLLVVVALEGGALPGLARAFAEVRAGPTAMREIALSPLREADVASLVDDALPGEGTTRDELAPTAAIAKVVFEASAGNPLVARELLAALHAGGALAQEEGTGRWTLREDAVREGSIAGDAAALFGARIAALPAATAAALSVASCLGARFDLDALAHAAGCARAAAAASVWPAVEAGLLHVIGGAHRAAGTDPPGDVTYAFAHGRAREAARARLSREQRREARTRAGRGLLEAGGGARLLEIIDLLGDPTRLPSGREEALDLARLYLEAGRRARRISAQAAALGALEAGLALLALAPGDPWESAYPLAFALHRDHAEHAHLLGRVADADAELALVLAQARSEEERAAIDVLRLRLAERSGDFAAAVRVGCAALARREIAMPAGDVGARALAAAASAVDAALAGRSIRDLVDAPVTESADEHGLIAILAHTLRAAARADLDRFRLAGAMIVKRSLRNGHAPFSSLGYAAYAAYVADSGDARGAACEIAELATLLSARLDGPGVQAMVQSLCATLVDPRRRPIRACFAPLEHALEVALSAGDLRLVGHCAVQRLVLGILGGEDLYRLMDRAGEHRALLRRLGEATSGATVVSTLRAISLLTRGSPPAAATGNSDLDSPTADDSALVATMGGDPLGMLFYATVAIHRALIFGDVARALHHGARARAMLDVVRGHPLEPTFLYYHGITLATAHDAAADAQRAALQQEILAYRDRLKVWADGCPENYQHRYLLIAAEAARLSGDAAAAMDLYDRAVESSAENQHPAGEAIAAEIAGRFHLAAGRRHVARAYLFDARQAYGRWGADAKADELGQRYRDLLPEHAAAARGPAWEEPDHLAAVRSAGLAISAELSVDGTARALLEGALALAGAERGVLVLGGETLIEARREAEGGPIHVARHEGPVDDRRILPRSIVKRVEESREGVVLEHAASGGPFRSDPYVVHARARSVLCLPVLRDDRLAGVLYLENGKIAGAFTPPLCAAALALAAQAAVALENAHAHDALVARARTAGEELGRLRDDLAGALARVKDTQKRLLVQEKLATLGGLTAGIAHEIKNPLNFINNFAESSIGIADEALEELSAARARLDPDAAANLLELLGELRKNAEKVNEHGRRAEGIVRAMLEHSRSGTATIREVDVNALLKEYTNLAYQGFRSQDPAFNAVIEASYAQGLAPIILVPQDLGRVFLNLVNNACYAVHAKKRALGSPFVPTLRLATRELGHAVQIRIRDNGTGIPAAVVARIYEPFFTTKPTGDGTGLGLAISNDIVEAAGGTLEVETQEGEFTEFVITLPRRGKQKSERP